MADMDNTHGREHKSKLGFLGYYWLLTFEQASALHSLTEECQRALDVTRFHSVHPDGLHLTLDRIAHRGEGVERLNLIESAARRACADLVPFALTIEKLTNLGGAIGFAVSPAAPIRSLRDVLRTATQSVLPDAPVKDSQSDPHITIAYPLREGLSADAAAVAMRSEAAIEGVTMTVTEAVMVALERHEHSYSWSTEAQIRLAGR
ncbi:2'-5' RNA ligase family protein [Nocardia beijingensis]|uniref:2'-5' RNA ligase family protein n=1 Tax=Nocardia beijingensis TaxID=95162 RepID=UPI0018962D9E|nr:2'-5' RNA ligase family protein [Nocardia beijingensis]MBF6465714.1 2'-5' RNA ligase family protein [Nocardia beijingensis]